MSRQLSGLDVDIVLTNPVLFDELREAISVHVPLSERNYAQIRVGHLA